MSYIFISYSHKDFETAQKIVDALARNKLDTWIDWKSIPKGEDWLQEIYHGIEGAEAFLFLISLDSVTSKVCNQEIAHAVKNGKRILPIFIAKVNNDGIYSVIDEFLFEEQKEEINRLNFIKCREGIDDFDEVINEIVNTINTDYGWVKYHTSLQVKALEWEGKKDSSSLLRGKGLREAEQSLETNAKKEPFPTELQKLYLLSSKKHEKKVRQWLITAAIAAALAIAAVALRPF